LLDAYVGETEKRIRAAFKEATSEDAVLVIDEADSFLHNRDQAVRSWEVSFVNEFLTQMEHFQGILICSTNRFNHLDPASIRRFSHKVEFNWLTSEGNTIFYEKLLSNLVSDRFTTGLRKRLSSIQRLAPGDFKTVRTQFSFYPKGEVSHVDLISALQSESDLKIAQAGGKRIGF
jgi:SpoVK/Ycf46/Vps4 family AAA+-type ATPase